MIFFFMSIFGVGSQSIETKVKSLRNTMRELFHSKLLVPPFFLDHHSGRVKWLADSPKLSWYSISHMLLTLSKDVSLIDGRGWRNFISLGVTQHLGFFGGREGRPTWGGRAFLFLGGPPIVRVSICLSARHSSVSLSLSLSRPWQGTRSPAMQLSG